jgi:hypothetical protein
MRSTDTIPFSFTNTVEPLSLPAPLQSAIILCRLMRSACAVQRAVKADPNNGETWATLAYTYLLRHRPPPPSRGSGTTPISP